MRSHQKHTLYVAVSTVDPNREYWYPVMHGYFHDQLEAEARDRVSAHAEDWIQSEVARNLAVVSSRVAERRWGITHDAIRVTPFVDHFVIPTNPLDASGKWSATAQEFLDHILAQIPTDERLRLLEDTSDEY